MIINPIIPIWLMSIICIAIVIFILYNKPVKDIKTTRQKKLLKKYIINSSIKILIIILLFVINLRFMIPNGENMAIASDLSVLFVIDTSVSMRALDYDGNKERFEGVINDCCYIVDELSNSKFSIITFSDTAQKVIPFTNDTDMVQAELKAISLENDLYAKGSSMNIVKDTLEKSLIEEKERQNEDTKLIVFFITDGEITKEGENLESFSNLSQYISDGAVMGYGTKDGGKMVNSTYSNQPNSNFYYIYYYDDTYQKVTAISKIDENNLKKIASDLKIDYIQMSEKSNIDGKLKQIKNIESSSQGQEEKINTYQDIYYYFAIPLVILLILDFIFKMRKIQ